MGAEGHQHGGSRVMVGNTTPVHHPGVRAPLAVEERLPVAAEGHGDDGEVGADGEDGEEAQEEAHGGQAYPRRSAKLRV